MWVKVKQARSAALFLLSFLVVANVLAQPLPAIFVAEQQATLAAERPGLLQRLAVKPGDKVSSGQMLAEFDSSDIKRDLATNRAQRSYLQDEIRATERLTQQGMANASDLARLKKDADVALANILWLKQRAERATLKAPFSGTVVEVVANAHEWVQAGQPILKLIAQEQLTLITSAAEAEVTTLKLGQNFPLKLLALNADIEAELTTILPQVDVQSGTVELRFKPLIPKALKAKVFPGMKALLNLEAAHGQR